MGGVAASGSLDKVLLTSTDRELLISQRMITDLGLVRPKIKSIVKFHQNILRLLEAVRVVGLVQPVQ